MNIITDKYSHFLSWIQRTYLLPYVLIICVVVWICHTPVPYSNEFIYLLRLFKTYHPDFLLNDWFFSSGAPEHFIFNNTFGLLTLFLPLEVVGWLGRASSWAAITAVLLRLARHFGINGWEGAFAILAWIGIGPVSPLGGEWIFVGFEAKCVSYFLLFWTFVLLLEDKTALGGLLLGLSFSFHPSVGLWGGLATCAALPALNMSVRRVAIFAICSVAGMLPGSIFLVPHLMESAQAATRNDWAYLASKAIMGVHLEPFSWPKREYFMLFLLWLCNVLYYIKNQSDRTIRFAFFFQTAAGVIFILGIVSRILERYDFLQYFPLRIFPMVVPLFFFLTLAKAIREHRLYDYGIIFIYVWVFAIFCLQNPIAKSIDSRNASNQAEYSRKDDLSLAFKWISTNTPRNSIIIAPPWRKDAWYLSMRSNIAHISSPLYHKLPEWRERVERLVGPVGPRDTVQDLQKRYEALGEESILEISRSYGANFLVSRSLYVFPRVAQVGEYNIYNIRQ